MIRIVDCAVEDPFPLLAERRVHWDAQTQAVVAAIIDDVRHRGDEALLDNARKFDAPDLTTIWVSEEELAAASLAQPHAKAIGLATGRVRAYYEVQEGLLRGYGEDAKPGVWTLPAVQEGGGYIGWRHLSLASAGVYVPGGEAAYPSSVIMNAVPAQVAGVPRVTIATPARSDGTVHPAVLYSIRYIGLTQVLKVGGAAAIAAFALGTETVARVDKIVGPGNRFVNEAKRQLWGQVGLDGYAGPSEVCVLADDHANARWAAADLLTQIEHAADNSGFLVTLSRAKADEVLAEAEIQLGQSPRAPTMRAALRDHSLALVAKDMEHACEILNAIAPEHLSLSVDDPEQVLDKVRNAGCVLLGEFTPESAGDFCLGPSHTLPTSGAARFGGPVSVLDFMKIQSVSRLTKEGLESLLSTIEAFGEMEGFPAHARGAVLRFRDS